MAELDDFDLVKTPDDPPVERLPRHPYWLWLVVAALVVATVAAAYLVTIRRQRAAAPVVQQTRTPAAPARPLGGEAVPIDLPPLDQSDSVVRELVKQITSHPRIAAWLATDGLLRSVTVGIENIADGATPAARFGVLRRGSGFETIGSGPDLRINPRSHERYNELADAMASIDAAGAARLYATLKPRLEEAYRDLGHPDTSFDQALERAIVVLLRTPVPNGTERLEPKGVGYGFVDPRLEGLTGAQKQLLRTGPRNVRIIQDSLRRIALALGIPAERLPAAPQL